VTPFSSRGPLTADQAEAAGVAGLPTGLKPDLVAPGLEVLSALSGGGWVSHGGTSMAAPHVAGAIALLRQAAPRLRVDEVEAILRRTARDVGVPGPDADTGAGLVDARAAVSEALGPALRSPVWRSSPPLRARPTGAS